MITAKLTIPGPDLLQARCYKSKKGKWDGAREKKKKERGEEEGKEEE